MCLRCTVYGLGPRMSMQLPGKPASLHDHGTNCMVGTTIGINHQTSALHLRVILLRVGLLLRILQYVLYWVWYMADDQRDSTFREKLKNRENRIFLPGTHALGHLVVSSQLAIESRQF